MHVPWYCTEELVSFSESCAWSHAQWQLPFFKNLASNRYLIRLKLVYLRASFFIR